MDDTAWPFIVPQQEWFAPRYIKRHSTAWRPFEGPLSPKSVLYALTVCRAMFRWLVQVRYLPFDPWPAVAMPRALAEVAPEMELTHSLSREDWQHVMTTIEHFPIGIPRVRAKLLLRLALVTGMRLAELAGACYDRIYGRPMRDGSGTRWMLKVLGKGSKWRSVPLTDDVMALLRENLRLRGLPDDPRSVPDGTPVFGHLEGSGSLTASGLAQLIKKIFGLAEQMLVDAREFERARVFGRASMHWIRHTTGAFLGDSGAPASQIQQLLGHASIATTSIYTSTGEDELFNTVKKVLTT